MDPKRQEPHGKHEELHEKRKDLHGKRRQLHERLSDVCEDFVLSEMTREHKQKGLVRELQYLLDYYRDDASWEGSRRPRRKDSMITGRKEYRMFKIQTILYPTDFSERSEAAFHLARSLARDHGARLIVLLHRLQAPGSAVDIDHRLTDGEPYAEILRVAEDDSCDLIVMGTHGRTGLPRLLMGSVAEQVVRRASRPVLTVKAPFPEPVTVTEAQAHETVKS